jgi:hypothetical protein
MRASSARLQVEQVIQDASAISADAKAAATVAGEAALTADSKRRIFVNTPTPPYDVGDQWAQGTSGDILICSTAKASGQSYAASDWTKASKYTDDTAAAAAQSTADDAKSAAADNASEIASIKTDYVTNSTFDQSNTQIKASVADTLSQVKTYTDGQISTEVTNRNAAITESASEIKSEVSETYATQESLATTDAKADAAQSTADDAATMAITMAITTDNGTVFKNSADTTTLTAHVYRAGAELSSQDVAKLCTVKWYRDGGTTAVGTGATLSVSASSVSSKAVYTAQLEG